MSGGPVLIDHAYPVEYVPRSGRSAKMAWVAGRVPVGVAELAEAPVAVEMERVLKPYPYLDTNPETRRETFRLVGGGLSRRVEGPDGRPLGLEALSGVDPAAPGGPWAARGYPFQTTEPEGRVADSLEALNPRLVKADGRAAAEARIAGLARRTATIGGVLHAPGPEPVWGVRNLHDSGIVQVAACLSDQGEIGQTFAMFRADRRERAIAVAEGILADAARIRPDRDYRVQVVGEIAVHRPEALAFDEIAIFGRMKVLQMHRHPGSSGFAALPVPVLREWLAFREAAERLEAGQPGALLECLSALARCKLALPDPPDPQSRAGHHDACASLHRQLAGLPAMVAHWEADAGAPVPDEDTAALSSALR